MRPELLAMAVPGPELMVPAMVAGLLALVLARGDVALLGDRLLVVGWFAFALSSPSAQFPHVLRPLGLVAAGAGAIILRLSQPPSTVARHRLTSVPVRLLSLYLFFVLLGCLASPFGPRNVFRWVQAVIIVVVGAYGVSLGRARALLLAIFLASFANVALTLISGTPEAIPGGATGAERLSGAMHPNHLAFAGGVVLIGLLWMAIYRIAPVPLLLGAAAMTTYVILASRSRTGLLAVLVAGLVTIAATPSARQPFVRRKAFLPLALLLVVPLALPATSVWVERDGSSASLTSITGRTELWPSVVDLIERRPVIGWGVNVELSPEGAEMQKVIVGVGQAHNSFLEAALQGGLPGAFAWTLSLVWVLVASFRLPHADPWRPLALAGSTLLLVFAFTESGAAWFGDMFIVYVFVVMLHAQSWGDLVRRRRSQPVRHVSGGRRQAELLELGMAP